MKSKVDKFIEIIGVVAITAMVLACIWQVFTRFVLNNPSGFTEEFMRYALIWTTMIGAPYAYGKGKHLSIVFAVNNLSDDRKKIVSYIVNIMVLLFAILVLIIGGIYVSMNAVGQISAAIGFPMQFLYLASPLSGILFVFYVISDFREAASGKENA